jgi:large subunit ribosomal protein L31
MKEGLHPAYNNDAVVKCACGNTFTTGSIKAELKIDVCSNCHPFYTGQQKVVDTGGRIEKFMKKYNLKDK